MSTVREMKNVQQLDADAVAKLWADHDWCSSVLRCDTARRVRPILESAGYLVAEGEVIQKPGNCTGCGIYEILQQALNSGDWLCSSCRQDDLCES